VLAPPCRLCPVVGIDCCICYFSSSHLYCIGLSYVSPLIDIVGGAMKPTTDGHWAHLACAIWIPGLFLYLSYLAGFSSIYLLTLVNLFQRPAYPISREWSPLMV